MDPFKQYNTWETLDIRLENENRLRKLVNDFQKELIDTDNPNERIRLRKGYSKKMKRILKSTYQK